MVLGETLAAASAVSGEVLTRTRRLAVVALLYAAAAAAWWSTASAAMPLGLPAFLAGWLVMMAAMMLPALAPVVILYLRAARRGTVAPVSVFVGGYLLVWTAVGVPAYLAWQRIQPAVMDGRPWAGRLAGGALVVSGLYQLSPLKEACLRGCRTPLSAFTAVRGSLARPLTAARVGARNGLWCLGCCWALMAVLVAVGVMQPWWMAGLAVVIFAEKALPFGPTLSRPFALALVGFGVLLLAQPHLLMSYTT
jgi:predicted metal-binding membrane protein